MYIFNATKHFEDMVESAINDVYRSADAAFIAPTDTVYEYYMKQFDVMRNQLEDLEEWGFSEFDSEGDGW